MPETSLTRDTSQQLLEAVPVGLLLVESGGKILFVNAHVEKLFGYLREELLGHEVELLVPERFRGRHPEYRAGFFAAPQVRSMGAGRDLYGLRKDASEFPIEIGLTPLAIHTGIQVLSTIIDITERKRTEERFRLVIESAPNAIVMVNDQGNITLVNSQTEKFFGYSREELLGQPVEVLVPHRFRRRHPEYRNGFFQAPQVRSMGVGGNCSVCARMAASFPLRLA